MYFNVTLANNFVNFEHFGPVVQSIISLTSSLRVISLTILTDSIYNILIYFAEKMWVAFAQMTIVVIGSLRVNKPKCSNLSMGVLLVIVKKHL